MKRAAWVLMALAAAAPSSYAKKAPPPAPAPPPGEGVRVERLEGGTRLEAVLPGWLRGYALPLRADGTRDVVLLVGAVWPTSSRKQDEKQQAEAPPCDGADPFEAARAAPTNLLRLDPTGSNPLEVLRDDLPADSWRLDAFDVDGDGAEELLLFANGEIRVFRDADGKRFAKGPEPLVSDSALGHGAREPRIVRSPSAAGALLSVATADGLHAYGRLPDGRFGLVSSTPLPLSTWLEYGSLRVQTAVVTELGGARGGSPLHAASGDGSDEVRADRLRSFLIEPSAPPGSRSVECWSKLPARERLHDRAYSLLDGRPAMMVTTTPADKLKIFGEKSLRLFLLEEDRTKVGKPPLLAADIGASLWQPVEPSLLDVDGDGRTDLVVAYWKGLKKDAVELDAFLRKEDGSFDPSPKATTIDAKDGDRTFLEYGRDLDGNGVADLLLIAGGKIHLFPGARKAPAGKDIVASTPRYVFPMPSFAASSGTVVASLGSGGVSAWTERDRAGIPRPVDLDGDGRLEILVAAFLEDGRSAFVIFRLASPD